MAQQNYERQPLLAGQPAPGAYHAGPGYAAMPPQHGQYQQQQQQQAPPQQYAVADCPPGLEYLAQLDQVLVHQQIELLEALTGFETNNKYAIKNSMGQNCYFAAEQTDCCSRNFCGSARPFEISVMDNAGKEVMFLHRPLRGRSAWTFGLGPINFCCLQELTVEAPRGNVIGRVVQQWSLCAPVLDIVLAGDSDAKLRITGPCLVCSCGTDIVFNIHKPDHDPETQSCGRLTKQWSGLLKEALTDADNFSVAWPMETKPKVKALLMAAVFLVDMMFFETSGNQNNSVLR